MMKVFDTYKSNIQTFREYTQYLFEDKMSPNFDKSDKINRLKEYVEELFDPKDETNKKTTKLTMEFGKIAAQAWLDEFRKKGNGKNTFKYLQSTDGELAFDKFNAKELEKFINLLANNNPSEEGWGIASAEYFGKTSILGGNTAAIAMSKYNKPFHIDHKDPNNHGWSKKEFERKLSAQKDSAARDLKAAETSKDKEIFQLQKAVEKLTNEKKKFMDRKLDSHKKHQSNLKKEKDKMAIQLRKLVKDKTKQLNREKADMFAKYKKESSDVLKLTKQLSTATEKATCLEDEVSTLKKERKKTE